MRKLALYLVLMLSMFGCATNGSSVDAYMSALAIVEANIEASFEVASVFLEAEGDGQAELEEFQTMYRIVRPIIVQNLAMLIEHYVSADMAVPEDIVQMQRNLEALDGIAEGIRNDNS